MKFLKSYDVIENYHILDGLALIMHFGSKIFIKASLQDLNRVRLPFMWLIWKGKTMVGPSPIKVYVAEMGSTILKMPTLDRVTEDVCDLNGNGSTTDKIPLCSIKLYDCCCWRNPSTPNISLKLTQSEPLRFDTYSFHTRWNLQLQTHH